MARDCPGLGSRKLTGLMSSGNVDVTSTSSSIVAAKARITVQVAWTSSQNVCSGCVVLLLFLFCIMDGEGMVALLWVVGMRERRILLDVLKART